MAPRTAAGPATNWAGNVTFTPETMRRPRSLQELQETVAGNARVRAVGTGHSFNRIADTDGCQISLDRMPRFVRIDPQRRTARVSAATTFAELSARLQEHGFALPNLGSLPHISLAGACATGTHGSGDTNASIARSVRSIDLVTADGEPTSLSRGDTGFDGAVLSIGALGVVTALELDLVPTFDVAQRVYTGLPWRSLLDRFDEVFAAAYSVSVFTDWYVGLQVWSKQRVGDDMEDFAGMGRPLEVARHPAPGLPAHTCTEQLGVPGPWHERLPHFRAEFNPSTGAELQSEYYVARADAGAALEAVRGVRQYLAPALQASEIRTVAADSCWIGGSHQRPSVAIHFTWNQNHDAVWTAIGHVERVLASFDPRPHWGKLSAIGPDRLERSYARWHDFARLTERLDPDGTFRNDLVDHYFPR
ncbi:FAD-binding protein [Kitasatospora sp. NPDC101176]|uniref:FAD-binding protein n=1 Tax=Kitasatospora sp. NPDC101176 TaxID=3364099 RepID=UPI00382FADBE